MEKLVFITILSCSLINAAPIATKMVDLTYSLNEHTQNFPVWKKFQMVVVVNGTTDSGVWYQGEEMSSATHIGTHMDAPSHFSIGGLNIDQIALKDLIAPAAVINIKEKAMTDPNAEVTVEDLENWEATTKKSLNGTVILVNSGWGDKWLNRTAFIGTNEEDVAKLNFPGVCPEAAQWLVDNRNIIGVGIDTLSFDRGNSIDYMSHQILLGKGIFGLENVANLDKIPIYGATLYIMPMKVEGASGAPTRIIATFPEVIFG